MVATISRVYIAHRPFGWPYSLTPDQLLSTESYSKDTASIITTTTTMSSQEHKNLYSDEVATEVHDIIHQAEEEEERVSTPRTCVLWAGCA